MKDQMFNIGVLLGNTFTDYPKEMLHGVYEAAKNESVNVLFFLGTQTGFFYQKTLAEENTDDYDYQYNTIYDCAHLANIDALIIFYSALGIFLKESRIEFLNRFEGIPYVVIDDEAEEGKGSSIIANSYAGMRENVEHLVIEHGCKKFLYLSGPKDNRDANERKRAFLDVLRENGLQVTDAQIAYGNYTRYVEKQVQMLLDENPGADALVCANDEMAFASYQVCKKMGLIVGTDIAITGFDDVEMAQFVNPPLTTISQNGYEIGLNAFAMAMQLCRGIMPEPRIEETKLKKRLSCGCKCSDSSQAGVHEQKAGVNYDLNKQVQNLTEVQRRSWFGPLLTRDLMQAAYHPVLFYTAVMGHLMEMGMKSAYLYVLKDPVEHNPKDPWICPEEIQLASFFDETELKAFEPNNRPVIHKDKGFTQLYKPGGGHNYTAYTLFSGEWIFGLMFCELELDEIADMYLVALHLGNSIRFLEVSIEEQSAKRQLQQKNEVLSFISDNDELTKLYNRRGLMEHLMALNQENTGRRAYLIFVDMDHLKEINDFYGHSEGDCAIKAAAGLLQSILEDGILGRIGGDEFVGVILKEPGFDAESIRQQIAAVCDSYNESSGNPYYVELSVGVLEFVCAENRDFTELFKKADTYMYEAKKAKRVSARR